MAFDMHPIRDRRVVLGMTGFDRGDAPFLFDYERRLRCEIARERDVASTLPDAVRRAGHLSRARALSARLPQSACERLLLTFG
ncbi:hypothetical protein [Sphingomonas mali]|uniref:hypothetical protein n=1 Tax=Sphingomonas mali TaxID=40682 RepID=UPI00082BA9A4|nr:hypothetical protein [Sphingomonas mali]